MDFHGLVATNLPRTGRPTRMDAEAEERYYRDHGKRLRPKLGPLAYVTTAGLILLLVGFAQT
jgi:hypothetical protein